MAAVTNLITNPSFETNTTSWTAANGTLSRDTTVVTPGTGVASGKVVATAASVVTLSYTATGLTIGQAYTFSFYSKISAVTTDFSLVPTVTGVINPVMAAQTTGDDFVRRYVGFIATGTSHTLVISSTANLSINDTFWVDRVMLNAGNLLPYFDGSYPFSAWTGTANASTSTNTAFDSTYKLNTDEVVVAGGLCMNTQAWNITTKTGRNTVSNFRGDDISVPGVSGQTFVPNKPLDSGSYTLTGWVLGIHPDGTVPPNATAQRVVWQKNYETILRACLNSAAPVTVYSWLPDGSVRQTSATLVGNSPDPTLQFGGRRAEVSLVFEVLPGMWQDVMSTTITGTASAAWSNQSLALTALANGTAPIEDSVITVTGPITNPTVSNTVTNTSITYTGTVPSGQTWVIDCGAWTSKVNGVSVLSSTTHSGHARFVVIDPGPTNVGPSIKLTGSGTTTATNLAITAYRKHLIGG